MYETEIPFEFRNSCFFCGGPRYCLSIVKNDALELQIPCCTECDSSLFTEALDLYGDAKIEMAIKFCLISTAKTSVEIEKEFADLKESLDEIEALRFRK